MVALISGRGVPITRRGALGLGVGCLLTALGQVRDATHPCTSSPGEWLAADRRALVSLDGTGGRIALTFDDGPDPAYTPHVLDLLARYGTPATFFVVGRNARAHPDLVARIRREGHLVANHTRDHVWLHGLAGPAVADQLDGGAADLVAAGAAAGGLLRPPRGWTSPTVAAVARARGLRSVFWTTCLEAHLHRGPRRAVAAMSSRITAGAIVLCHDGGHLDGPNPQAIDRSATVAALPDLLALIGRRGLTPVTLAGA